MNVGGDLAKLVPGRVSTEVDARLAYDTHGIIRKVGFFNLLLCRFIVLKKMLNFLYLKWSIVYDVVVDFSSHKSFFAC